MNTLLVKLLPGIFLIQFLSLSAQEVQTWLTTADRSQLFQLQANKIIFTAVQDNEPTIFVDDHQKFQTMDGFGCTLTGGSAMLLRQMEVFARTKLLEELFTTQNQGIGISYLRISIGASDLDEEVFSYTEVPAGQTDPGLDKFSLLKDQLHLIPVLKEILAFQPKLKIMASPWSPPVWMKDNGSSIGGKLKPEYYRVYANYLVKYIQGMIAFGIPIDAITVQNEPLHPGNNPSLLMPANEQALFIRDFLGPAFKQAKLKTKIIIYDHNADRPDYPIQILNDQKARKFIHGSAFHLYGGVVETIRQVQEAHPDKELYFTEQWIGAPADFGGDLGWHTKHLMIGAPRNGCKTVLEWNLAADAQQKPHTAGGCTRCLGALTVTGNQVDRNPAYYILAHSSKHVRPGSVRIASNTVLSLYNIAYRTPEGQKVVLVYNESNEIQQFNLGYRNLKTKVALPGGAVATYVWK